MCYTWVSHETAINLPQYLLRTSLNESLNPPCNLVKMPLKLSNPCNTHKTVLKNP